MYNNNPVSKLNGNVTLVLNASYIPLAVCSSKRALCLYFLDKIDIIHNYNDYCRIRDWANIHLEINPTFVGFFVYSRPHILG